jgi:hypothetical protein
MVRVFLMTMSIFWIVVGGISQTPWMWIGGIVIFTLCSIYTLLRETGRLSK